MEAAPAMRCWISVLACAAAFAFSTLAAGAELKGTSAPSARGEAEPFPSQTRQVAYDEPAYFPDTAPVVQGAPPRLTPLPAEIPQAPPTWMPQPVRQPAAGEFPTIDITGFFQLDTAWFHQDAANRLTPGIGDIQDFTAFRRARLAAVGDVAENVAYMLELDFGFPGRPSFMDVWMELQETSYGDIRIGQFRQPFSMDAMTSIRDLAFLERALPSVFTPLRQTGIMAHGTGMDDLVTWGVAGYRFQVDPFGDVFGDAGYGVSGRGTAAWIYEPQTNYVVHFGGSFAHQRPNTDTIAYRNTPEIGALLANPLVPFFVDTGAIPASGVTLFGVEGAYANGSLLVQSELIAARVNQSGGPNPTFTGGYVQASYVLTGEVRPYNLKQGVFGRVKPHCNFGPEGNGAWEVATRWSYLDLDDANIAGGKLSDFTAGLNWHLNAFTKLQFHYTHAWLDHPATGDSNADVYAIRAQLDF